ncbi:hypothetical protein VaNZ11_015260 [Volvox africanus]|uniref:Tr-type G domain-containing protein n=1 Tax=Volvox africanus TaxID=51714 RepID=A0ABQ5SLL7_9CHLO|nr:hypothetical protein VaNZ11_015260 [Volvox africanus]
MAFDLSKLEDWSSSATVRNPTTWVAFETTTQNQFIKAKRRKGARGRATTAEMAAMLESGGKSCRQEQILRPEQIEALRLKGEPKDLSVACLEPEDGEGNVEYKYRIKDPHPVRLQQLITQMKYRLSEGNGECFYYIGIEDNGYPKGLEPAELEASIGTLQRMAASLDAFVTLVHYLPAAWGRRAALLRVATSTAQEACHTDLRIAVAGSVDAGKSTLVAVLTHGSNGRPILDNGRGLARMNVFRHKHEMQSGRTSSICHQLLGYDRDGRVINYMTPAATALTPAEVTSSAAKVLTFLDMGGHEKYLKTALYGMTALLPDFGLLCVCAVGGLGRIAREHLAVAVALEVPVAIIITKVELVNAERFAAVLAEVRQLVALTMCHESSPGTAQHQHQPRTVLESATDERRVEDASPLVTTEAEALASARVLCQLHADTLASPTARGAVGVHMPVFAVSAVTGAGLPALHAFLNALQSPALLKAACHTPLATAGSSNGLQSSVATGASVSLGADSSCDGASSCDGTSAGGSPLPAGGSVEFDSLDTPSVASAAAAAAAAAGPQQQLLYAPAAAAVATAEAQAVHFQVDGTFEVEGVGSVVSGTLVSGMVRVDQELLLGPTAAGDFTRVVVRQLQRSHVQVKQVRAGQTCTIAISPAVVPQPVASSAAAAVATNRGAFSAGAKELPLGTSPGMGPMAAAAAAASIVADGDHRVSSSGFEDALAAAQTALELCLAGGSDEDDGGGDDDLFGFDASDGPAPPPARRAKVPPPQPSLGSAPQPTFRGSSFDDEAISMSTAMRYLHSTTSFCVGGEAGAGVAAPDATAGSAATATPLSTSEPPPRTFSLGATPSPFTGVASRSKGAVLLEPALQPRTSWTFEAVLILLGGHWPPRGLVSGRWPPAGNDEVDAAMQELELRCLLDPQTAAESSQLLQRSGSSNGPPSSGRSGSMTPASGGAADGSEMAIGEKVGSDGDGSGDGSASGSGVKRDTDLLIGALSDVGGSCGASGVAAMTTGREHEHIVPSRVSNGGNRQTAALGGDKSNCRRRRQRAGIACSYVTVVHCGSVRQPAQVLMVQELIDDGPANEPRPDGASSPYSCPDLRISASTRAAAALLHSASVAIPAGQLHPPLPAKTTDGSSNSTSMSSLQQPGAQQPVLDHDLGCLVRVVFRWQHRPEWLREGAKLLVRDRGDGRVAGAGFVRRVLF